MYKARYKANDASEVRTNIDAYSSESAAITDAMRKTKQRRNGACDG